MVSSRGYYSRMRALNLAFSTILLVAAVSACGPGNPRTGGDQADDAGATRAAPLSSRVQLDDGIYMPGEIVVSEIEATSFLVEWERPPDDEDLAYRPVALDQDARSRIETTGIADPYSDIATLLAYDSAAAGWNSGTGSVRLSGLQEGHSYVVAVVVSSASGEAVYRHRVVETASAQGQPTPVAASGPQPVDSAGLPVQALYEVFAGGEVLEIDSFAFGDEQSVFVGGWGGDSTGIVPLDSLQALALEDGFLFMVADVLVLEPGTEAQDLSDLDRDSSANPFGYVPGVAEKRLLVGVLSPDGRLVISRAIPGFRTTADSDVVDLSPAPGEPNAVILRTKNFNAGLFFEERKITWAYPSGPAGWVMSVSDPQFDWDTDTGSR